jgi:tRNA threonylcarbamoyladenosine biosynthesis protein TsaE
MTQTVYISMSPEDTQRLARELVATLSPQEAVIALHGELGSGKTCFVKGLARALEIANPITSPTFTLINEYRGLRPLYHMDLYRVTNPDELAELALEDYIEAPGITIIEWAERAADSLPPRTIHVTFTVLNAEQAREIAVQRPTLED